MLFFGRGPAWSAERPSVFLNREEVAGLRAELETVEWKREMFNRPGVDRTSLSGVGIKSNVDYWLNRKIVIPARSGHGHNFVCDDGNWLVYPKDCMPDPNGYPCSVCGKVYKGERYDGAVRHKLHNKIAVAAFDLGLVYALYGDKRYAEKAAEILLKYADAYPGPHTTNVEGGIMYQSLCEAVWVIPLAGAYDFIYESEVLSPADRKKIEDKLFRPVAEGLVKMGAHGNWGSWHLSAVGVIGYAIRDGKLVQYALTQFRNQIATVLGDDGLWPESVHTYHFYPLSAFLYLAEAAFHNGTDLYHWEAKPGKGLKAMFTAPLSYMYPDLRLPAINDGWFNTFLPLSQYDLAHARYGDPSLGWAVAEGRRLGRPEQTGIWTLLYGTRAEKELPAPEIASVNFPVLGIAVLRSPSGNMMTFDYGPFLGHGQLDKMGVTLFANGELLAADYGTPPYGSKILGWYLGTPGHNTVVVDGKSQAKTNERRLTLFATGKTFEVAQAETEQAYPGVLHRRAVLRVGESFIVIDDLKSETAHTYDWFMRSEGALKVNLRRSALKPLGYEYVREQAHYDPGAGWSANWNLTDGGLKLAFPEADKYSVTAAKCPAESGTRLVDLLIVCKSGKEARFVAVLVPPAGARDASCSIEHGLVKLNLGDTVDWVYLGDSADADVLKTDAKFALVRVKDSKPVLASVIGGTSLEWEGRSVVVTSGGQSSVEREYE